LKELGLDRYAYIPNWELKKVAKKFDEYASFSVDMKKLLNHIGSQNFTKQHKLQNQKYRDFIDSKMPNEDSKFPLKEVNKKAFYRDKWVAHKRLAVARAYDRYLDLLDKRKSYDFNLLQIKTRDNLKEMDRSKVVYKNILVDEFQDTDIIQFEIFELLSEGSETVTYVGDINQSIYGWRGAVSSNFNRLIKGGKFEVKELLTNYRSPKNFVALTNRFMVDEMELRANNLNDGDLYYLNNRDKGEQAKKIVATIKHLKKENKVQKYSDIGLLFRSTRMNYIEELLNELKANGIKFNIRGAPDFEIYPEVDCVLLLLWYLTKNMPYSKVFNLKEFANHELNNEMFNFKDSTLKVLSSYNGSPREFSMFNMEQLKGAGIVDEKDLRFFHELNQLKYRFHNASYDDFARLDLIRLYYELFRITGYIKNKFEEIRQKGEEIDTNVELLNLGLISRKINDFMDTVDRFDIDNLFEFLDSFYKEYSSPSNSLENDDRVQILTIHKSKGLEFPVVFVCSLMEFSFPKRKPIKEKITDFPTPLEIKYEKVFRNIPIGSSFKDEYNNEFKKEEQRILYVGLTRAKSTLFISHIINNAGKSCKEFLEMKKDNPHMEELHSRKLPLLSSVKTKQTW
jgi:DNA helicase-2/ATP-dependent DNA helicase PcrA